MGAWGVKLYQDDISEDLKIEYTEKLKKGKSNEEAYSEIISDYEDFIDDEDDAPVFWFALADIQWNIGRLLPEVKQRAIEWIDSGKNQERWMLENPKSAKARAKVLEELKQKLNTPQPPEKKISPYMLYKCPWKIGDVFSLRLTSEKAKDMGLDGKYLMIQKVGEYIAYPGHITPIVRAWFSDIQQYTEDRAYCTDCIECGGVTISGKIDYVFSIYTTSKRVIPKNLFYCGNFKEFIPNLDRGIIKDILGSVSCLWKTLEEYLTDNYWNFNLRNAPFYQEDDE
jgi:hypothetical protein